MIFQYVGTKKTFESSSFCLCHSSLNIYTTKWLVKKLKCLYWTKPQMGHACLQTKNSQKRQTYFGTWKILRACIIRVRARSPGSRSLASLLFEPASSSSRGARRIAGDAALSTPHLLFREELEPGIVLSAWGACIHGALSRNFPS